MFSLFQPLLLLVLLATQCTAQPQQKMQKITENGMTVVWKIDGDHLDITMSAPTNGWVAIGINTVDGLAGTNLVMGCVVDGKSTLSDRYIIAPGDHKSITDLGGAMAAQLQSGTENKDGTQLRFTIPLRAADQWHKDLSAGLKIHLLMAFSREDDFMHHSMMRTAVEISL